MMKIMFKFSVLVLVFSTAAGSYYHPSIADHKAHGQGLFHPKGAFYPHELLQENLHSLGSQGKVLIAHEIGNVANYGADLGHISGVLGHDFGEHSLGPGIHGDLISHGHVGAGGKKAGGGIDLISIPLIKSVQVVKHVPVVKKVPVVKTVEIVRHVPVVKRVPVVQHVTVIASDAVCKGLVSGCGKGALGHGGLGHGGLGHGGLGHGGHGGLGHGGLGHGGLGHGGLGHGALGHGGLGHGALGHGGHGASNDYDAGYFFGGGHHDAW